MLFRTGMYGQNCYVHFSGTPDDVSAFKKELSKQMACDSVNSERLLNGVVTQLNQKGYLLASYLRHWSADTLTVTVYLGQRFSWALLDTDAVPDRLLRKNGFRPKSYRNGPFNDREIKRLFGGMVREGENAGFPFASIHLDSVNLNSGDITAKLIYAPGPKITFDSLKFQQSIKVKKEWLATYLSLEQGTLFSQKKVEAIGAKVRELGFLVMNKEPYVTFQNKEASVMLDLSPRKTSRIDGIIGFLPNEEEEGKLLITGQFDLSLRNLFSSGKGLDIQWQSLKARSQLLDIDYSHPNLFRSSLDLKGSFNLLKEDTIFTTRQGELDFTYKPSQHSFTIFTQFRSSNLIGTINVRDIEELPDLSDFSVDYYGLRYGFNTLNDALLPTAGISVFIDTGVGSKRIRRNSDFPEELYAGIDLNSIQYLFKAGFRNYWRWNKHLVFHQSLNAAKVINDRLFLNDLFRVGGLATLRGFNENFFFASDYVLSRAELQFYFQQDSYFFGFYDQAYLYYDVESNVFEDYPLGVGLGLNLATSSGVVSLAYGVGKAEGQPLSLSLSKFHFGYIAKF